MGQQREENTETRKRKMLKEGSMREKQSKHFYIPYTKEMNSDLENLL